MVCGTKRTYGNGVCINMCHWLLTGWVAYDATLNEVKFLDSRALPLAKLHKWNPKTKRITAPSFPKLVAMARAWGWTGDTAAPSQPTFVEA